MYTRTLGAAPGFPSESVYVGEPFVDEGGAVVRFRAPGLTFLVDAHPAILEELANRDGQLTTIWGIPPVNRGPFTVETWGAGDHTGATTGGGTNPTPTLPPTGGGGNTGGGYYGNGPSGGGGNGGAAGGDAGGIFGGGLAPYALGAGLLLLLALPGRN